MARVHSAQVYVQENVINHMSGRVGGFSARCLPELQAQPAGHQVGVGPEPGTEAQCPLGSVGSPRGGRRAAPMEVELLCPVPCALGPGPGGGGHRLWRRFCRPAAVSDLCFCGKVLRPMVQNSRGCRRGG